MAEVTWTETSANQWAGSVGTETLFRVEPVQDSWYLASALPLPLDSNTMLPTEHEAKCVAQRAVDGLIALLGAIMGQTTN